MQSPRLSFFFTGHGHHRDLHSFPTRRSSDLPSHTKSLQSPSFCVAVATPWSTLSVPQDPAMQVRATHSLPVRSEEHTSELQSRRELVCRLLLEKKNKL